ncbi:MAG: Inositol 2-dehydrogenase [Lentisphaerae bacterium ADurb.Bin242]|nr:MAG: Inositol 2-dehydrogenase [Lentisphaerae bacterium ADurb.Bin242]
MKEIKCGIIGSGVIAPVHLESYRKVPGVTVRALCDIVPGKAQALADKYGVPRACLDYHEILNDPEIDCVSVCTDHASHGQIVADALDKGKHVICEKCLTATDTQLDLALKAHKRNPERVFAGVFQHRFEPANILLRKMIREGKFGTLLTASLNVACLRTDEYYNSDPWRGTWAQEGGSVLINQAVHHFDLLRYFLGEIDSLCASYSNRVHQKTIETEDTINAILKFKNGMHVTFCATSGSFAVPWRSGFFFTGTQGYLEYSEFKPVFWKFLDETLTEELGKKFAECEESKAIQAGKNYYGTGHPAQIADFIDAVRDSRAPFVTGEDSGETARAIHACYESARTGKWIQL